MGAAVLACASLWNSLQETYALRDACAAELPGGSARVRCPAVGETITASTGSSAFQV